MGQAIAVKQRTGRAWRRVALIVALAALIMAGALTLVYGVAFDRGAASVDQQSPVITENASDTSKLGDSCREAIIVPRVGWVCTGH
jgi:hypothetical protein